LQKKVKNMEKEKNATMLVHVEDWKHSGMTIREYSQSIGISKGMFEYWVKKAKAINNAKDKYPGFIEVSPLVKSQNYVQPQMPSPPNPQIILNFPSGLCLKIYG
jgi:hypothetical protein